MSPRARDGDALSARFCGGDRSASGVRLMLGVAAAMAALAVAADATTARAAPSAPSHAPRPVPRPQTTAVSTFDAHQRGTVAAPTGANASLAAGVLSGRGAAPAAAASGGIAPPAAGASSLAPAFAGLPPALPPAAPDSVPGAVPAALPAALPAASPAEQPAARAVSGRRFGDHGGVTADDAPPTDLRSGTLAFALLDLDRETLLARRAPDVALIPASVAKAPTALYALDALGPDFAFETKLLASGPVDHGVLVGDLVLQGGGDPTLDSADLATLAQALRDAGVVAVEGRFLYDSGDTPGFERIAAGQPPQAAYNPGYSGLNLNFNRVLAEWRRDAAAGIVFTLSARAGGWGPPADVISAEAAPPSGPGFESRQLARPTGPGLSAETIEHWRVAEHLLGSKGARWLPVRRPARYAAGAFRGIAADLGVSLPRPEPGRPPAEAAVVARVESKPLASILRGMLKHSTNVTAEAVGITASRARGVLFQNPVDITASGEAMSAWLEERFGLDGVDAEPMRIENHSGLSTQSRVSVRSMVKLLARAAKDPTLGPAFIELLPRDGVRGAKPKSKKARAKSAVTLAKTGTIFYGRSLAGYLECPGGQRYAFAIFASDLDARAAFDAAFDPGETGAPRAARAWLGRARAAERALLSDWTDRYCG